MYVCIYIYVHVLLKCKRCIKFSILIYACIYIHMVIYIYIYIQVEAFISGGNVLVKGLSPAEEFESMDKLRYWTIHLYVRIDMYA
jgi:hypothetical protein